MNEPEQTIMRTSLSRPQQLLGGDREMVIMAGLGAAMMAVSVMTFVSFLLAIVGFWTIVIVLARIGKADPMMRKVYSRHLQYKDFYPAKSGVTALARRRSGAGGRSVWRDAETADRIGGPAPVVWAGR
jgi:type IV secretion system protein TrbD